MKTETDITSKAPDNTFEVGNYFNVAGDLSLLASTGYNSVVMVALATGYRHCEATQVEDHNNISYDEIKDMLLDLPFEFVDYVEVDFA